MYEAFRPLFPGQPVPMVPPLEEPPVKPAKRRARQAEGQFKGDDPSTPEVNEAWEEGEP
jgi:hypothetical protein